MKTLAVIVEKQPDGSGIVVDWYPTMDEAITVAEQMYGNTEIAYDIYYREYDG